MNLWSEREKALKALTGELLEEGQLLDRAFQQLEYLAQALDGPAQSTPFGRAAALIAAKARSLAQATYSLMLDGLGQEAGAGGRVWLEAIELLTYLYQDASRVAELWEGRLPPPGKRAKAIGGFSQPLREFWNQSASHIGLEPDSWIHVINWRTGRIKTRFSFSPRVLRTNMRILFTMMIWNIREAAMCLHHATGGISEPLARQIDSLKDHGLRMFDGPALEALSARTKTT